MNQLSTEDRCRVLACLVEGNSIRATVRITGIAKLHSLQLRTRSPIAADYSGDGRWPLRPRLGDVGDCWPSGEAGGCSVRLIASETTPCAVWFASCERGPRFLPFGQPPSFAFALAARAFLRDVTLPPARPSRAAGFISFPQCGQFMSSQNSQTFRYLHEDFQSSPLPGFVREGLTTTLGRRAVLAPAPGHRGGLVVA